MDDLISIVIPAYNAEKYLEQCLESILVQTYPNFECLIINDGSTDRTQKIGQTYAEKDGRIRVINQKNSGVSMARNTGMEEAKGEFLFFLDADDWVEKDILEQLLVRMVSDHSDMAICAVHFEYSNFSKIVGYKQDAVKNQEESLISLFQDGDMRPVVWGKLYKRLHLQEHGIRFEPTIFYSEDVLFITDVLLQSCKISTLSKPMYHYRLDNDHSAQNVIKNVKQYNYKIESRWKAYCLMQEKLLESYKADTIVFRSFFVSKLEVAKELLMLQERFHIKTAITKTLKNSIRNNFLRYCCYEKSWKKKSVLFADMLFPAIGYRIRDQIRGK